ncbi:hypothetical protein Tco_0728474 [Tanacetum coccineum]|uniref:Uncharacterized protein n=1 Tax=Tanacetum coccineum TaxID=301880 RepID=A0ABQ4YPH3_9ASTR
MRKMRWTGERCGRGVIGREYLRFWMRMRHEVRLEFSNGVVMEGATLVDFGFYAGGDGDGSRINRNLKRGNGGNADGMTHTGFTKYGSGKQVSPSEFSPGMLDLHSFHTEFLTEVVN